MKKNPYCPCCKQLKTTDDFNKLRGNWIQAICKECTSKKQKKHYQKHKKKFRKDALAYAKKNKEYYLLKRRIYKRILRLEVFRHYSNGIPQCSCCGERTLEFLAMDHIGGGGNEKRRQDRQQRGDGIYFYLKKKNYPDGFRVLCHNCNFSFGAYGYCPHSSGTHYLDVPEGFVPKERCIWVSEQRIKSNPTNRAIYPPNQTV